MADDCIVCLGSLADSNLDASPTIAPSSPHQDGNGIDEKDTDHDPDESASDKLIAFLPSCGHYLHNDCLKSWIERANSCPICRKTFNMVDLWTKIGGPAISSYTVDDKVQEAVIDPDILVDVDEDEEEDESQVCQVCEEDDNEDILMYCDNCDKLYHTYCVGLQEVPVGHWFCDHCRAQRDEPTRPLNQRNRSSRGYNRRTRAQRRRYRQQDRVHEQSWNRVWQSVWDSLNLDLDFPFDDEESTAIQMRRQRQRNDHDRRQYQAWQRRAQIAEMQGGANRFRDTSHQLLDDPPHRRDSVTRRPRPATPPQESLDEIRAWHAFDRALEIENDPVASRTRKRKSATASPAEPEPAPRERRIKRPRIRRQPEVAETSDSAESSSRRPPSPTRRQTETVANVANVANIASIANVAAPSFLQSLLNEVQGSATPNQRDSPFLPAGPIHTPPPEQNSPAPSSPILSPIPSNHSSPRAGSITPPPFLTHFPRPGSPTGLSSSIQPIFPQIENGHVRSPPQQPAETTSATALQSADRASKEMNGNSLSDSEPALGLRRIPRSLHQRSPSTGRVRSNDTSPARLQLSLSAKQDVQKIVSAALKPFYNDGKIDKDDFTKINRDVSRMMYEVVGTAGMDKLAVEEKGKLEDTAKQKVKQAVESMTKSPPVDGATGSGSGEE